MANGNGDWKLDTLITSMLSCFSLVRFLLLERSVAKPAQWQNGRETDDHGKKKENWFLLVFHAFLAWDSLKKIQHC
jgi:hypothetical protein